MPLIVAFSELSPWQKVHKDLLVLLLELEGEPCGCGSVLSLLYIINF